MNNRTLTRFFLDSLWRELVCILSLFSLCLVSSTFSIKTNEKTIIVFTTKVTSFHVQMKNESVDVEHRPLGRVGGALFCFLIFITSFYGAIFLLGPCFALIYIWPWLYRRVVDRIVAFWLIFPIGEVDFSSYNNLVIKPCSKRSFVSSFLSKAMGSTTWNELSSFSIIELVWIGCSFGPVCFTVPDCES